MRITLFIRWGSLSFILRKCDGLISFVVAQNDTPQGVLRNKNLQQFGVIQAPKWCQVLKRILSWVLYVMILSLTSITSPWVNNLYT